MIKEICCKNKPMDSMFVDMNDENLVSCLAILLYTIDSKGIDISKMIMGYCNISPQIINSGQVDNSPSTEVEDNITDIEDVENCGIDLC